MSDCKSYRQLTLVFLPSTQLLVSSAFPPLHFLLKYLIHVKEHLNVCKIMCEKQVKCVGWDHKEDGVLVGAAAG